jgi:hypothetical protein
MTKMMNFISIMSGITFLTVALSAWPSFAECSPEQAMEAETTASVLKDWDSVYKAFKKYAKCDDGAIAEGFSESISQLLANQWDSLGNLERLIKSDRKFGDFVVRHVDQTISADTALKIHENIEKRCPPKSRAFCKRIDPSSK